ncbi:hypothetical protein ADK51_25185 [Streptomyces sp. WM6368]|nr:hypothetical protein ADK51_25185 [Streptomyces sp. WM6368]
MSTSAAPRISGLIPTASVRRAPSSAMPRFMASFAYRPATSRARAPSYATGSVAVVAHVRSLLGVRVSAPGPGGQQDHATAP